MRREGFSIYERTIMANIEQRMRDLESFQNENGTWNFNFEGPIMTDCMMIMIIRTLELKGEEETLEGLLQRILRLQQENGSWNLYPNEREGNLSSTVQAYTALMISGKFTRKDEEVKRAEQFIRLNGGIKKVHFMTKMMLALNGLYDYPRLFHFPMAYYLMPSTFPLSLYHCSNYARIHLTPMIICMNRHFTVSHHIDTSFYKEENQGGWFREERNEWTKYIYEQIKLIALSPKYVHQAGNEAAKKLMLKRIEKNGTLYSYVSASFYMIYALLALGHTKFSSIVLKAANGMLSYQTITSTGRHIQNSPSTVWDCALLTYSLQEAGMPPDHPVIQKASDYLVSKQQKLRGDWAIHAPNTVAGGWGFSDSNHFVPDNDDTSAVLRALAKRRKIDGKTRRTWEKGHAYLISMQNRDGGWGAFEKNAYHPLFRYIPLENAKDALIDDSTSDLTGRVLEYLGNYAGYSYKQPFIKQAAKWLMNHQQKDGSWYGKWGVCYIYGTWAAMTGLAAIGVKKDHPVLKKATDWLESIQHEDGGFGESCKSAEREQFVNLEFSTPSQTAWALDALLTVKSPSSKSVKQAVEYLINDEQHHPQAKEYPTGMGLPGGFYIHYQSYNEIFPLLALGHYLERSQT